MMKAKKSKTDAGAGVSGKDNDNTKSKQKKNIVKTTQVSSSPSHSNTAIQNTVLSTVGDVKQKKKTRNGNKVVAGNLDSNLDNKTVSEGNSSINKKKRKRDVSESASPVAAKKPKKESYKSKEKLKALSIKKWAKAKRKMKLKKAKQSLGGEGEENDKSGVDVQISSLDYLRQWKNDKGNWSFQKVRQVWLLKNMYNKEKVPEEDFPILLEYLEGLQGAARKVTVEQAEKIMKDADDDTDDVEAEKSTFSDEQLDRVRQVLQLL